MKAYVFLVALGVFLTVAAPASAAPTAQISTATVDSAWTRAHVAGSVSCMDCTGSNTYVDWLPVVSVQPSLPQYYCRGDEWADSDPNTRILWAGGKQAGNTTVPFDLVDALILTGVFGQRVCASIVHTSRYQEPVCLAQAPVLGYPPSACPLEDHIVDSPLTGALLTVEQANLPSPPSTPPPSTPPPTSSPPRTGDNGVTSTSPLSIAVARLEAAAALRASAGRRWTKGTNKKLACVRARPDAVNCSAHWRYRSRKLSRRIRVSVAGKKVTARVKR